ncbi:hypothetical protein Nepgr_019655 [Nepenthes gracilis]|uniref:DUF7880 domain-containing protein n=1 Tax=Nepenthes gracilis TaxID=150966 RepID=A0AAD3SVL3_NEPGR|nr:hypothetical protein Nepgr_019655 [Nepenthes gracilis]
MSATHCTAQAPTCLFPPIFTRCSWIRGPSNRQTKVKCALSQERNWQQSRRMISVTLVLLRCLSLPHYAIAGSIFDKYVKRKKLEPLESYVPAVILTQFQIKDIERSIEVEKPQYVICRTLLRSGTAASLRVNIRAVAQYASDGGKGKIAMSNVDQCLRALEELDSLLLHASRNDPEASIQLMKEKIGVALSALDSLLQTVPSDILDRGKAIADAYRSPEEDVQLEDLDQQLKQLDSIL